MPTDSLRVYPAKLNWWCSTWYGLLNKQICHFANLLRCTLTFVSRIWVWNALGLPINQDPPTKEFSGFRQTGRANLAQEEREKKTLSLPPQGHGWDVHNVDDRCCYLFRQNFSYFFTSSPHLFGEVPMLHGLQRCCHLEVPSSQEQWFCETLLGSEHLNWAVHARKIIGEKTLSEILEHG